MSLEVTRFERAFRVKGTNAQLRAELDVIAVSVAEAEAIADTFWRQHYHDSYNWTVVKEMEHFIVRRILPDND